MSIYYAIEFDDQTMKKLKEKQFEVKRNSIQGDFVQPETFHITVLFCVGGYGGYSRSDYVKALDEMGKRYNHKQFSLNLQNFGQFPGRDNNGNVVWVGVKNSFPLYQIKSDLEETIKDMNVKIEPSQFKGYTPHITMAYNCLLKEEFNTVFDDNEEITIKSISLWDSFKSKNQDKESHVYNKVHELFFS